MISSSIVTPLLLAVISLGDVSGERLVARAGFDANNVRLGDPMTLSVDFIGDADFSNLHPPALSREVDRKTWKIDDASAKTDTGDYSRRLVYRVRPMREGLLEFPALEFEYSSGEKVARVSTRAVPVHVKPGTQAALAGLDETAGELPLPDGLVSEVHSVKLSDDEAFAWRKAIATARSSSFERFDFPEARLNEAACLVVEGSWAKALKIYSRLEWITGQTKTIERGIVAALARKTGDAHVELNAWRIALRPLLAHAWRGRCAIISGAIATLVLLFWLSGRIIRALAVLAAILAFVLPARAQGIFEEMERMHQMMQQQMNQMLQMGSQGSPMQMTINGRQEEPVNVAASASLSTNDLVIGENFEFLVSLEAPRAVTLDQLRFTPSEMFGLVTAGKVRELEDGKSANPSNRVRRVAIPVRYDVPFKGEMVFRIDGMAQRRVVQGRSSFSFAQNFTAVSAPLDIEIKPLPTDNQPADFSGAIGTKFKLSSSVDRTRVETNDVVRITYTLECETGYIPSEAVPDIVMRRPGRVRWLEYFVARGDTSTPKKDIVIYDASSRTYERIEAKPHSLYYTSAAQEETDSVAIDSKAGKDAKIISLRFAPSDDAPIVENWVRDSSSAPLATSGTRGEWVRVETPSHAGWARKEELK